MGVGIEGKQTFAHVFVIVEDLICEDHVPSESPIGDREHVQCLETFTIGHVEQSPGMLCCSPLR